MNVTIYHFTKRIKHKIFNILIYREKTSNPVGSKYFKSNI